MSISRWQHRQGQTYTGPVCFVHEMWADFERAIKHDNQEIKDHELKLAKDAFYSAICSVCFELNAFGFDPEAVGLALGIWSREHSDRLGAQMDHNELTAPLDKQMTRKPSKN